MLFDGVSDNDLETIVQYLQEAKLLYGHPMLIPIMVMEILNQYSSWFRNTLERTLCELEVHLGVTRGRPQVLPWNDPEAIDRLGMHIGRCNALMTSLIYHERRLEFLRTFADDILSILALPKTPLLPLERASELSMACLTLEETTRNCITLTRNQIHQVLCLQKRSGALSNVVS